MIAKVQQGVNYGLIKESAYITVNLLKTDSKSSVASDVYNTYLTEGRKAPGYAAIIMKTAQNDEFIKDTRKMLSHNLETREFESYIRNLCRGFYELSNKNSEAEARLEEAGKKMYAKTWELRQRILNVYQDNCERRHPSSHLKDLIKEEK